MTYHRELKTIGDYVRFATSAFNEAGLYFGHGTDNAWDEAVSLVLTALHLPHDTNPSVLNANLLRSECRLLTKLIDKRIKERIPVAYSTHSAWFAGLNFYVDERVLIPRSSIAELIQAHFQPWIAENEVHSILDMCTGSGCIAIACAKEFPNAKVDASDISSDALAVAKINVLRHNVDDQVDLYQSDLFAGLPHTQYDIIISNPPYVSLEEMSALPREYQHEPRLGLEAGVHGLDFVEQILTDARNFLSPRGILIVEVGNSEKALTEQYPDLPFLWLEFESGEGGVFMLTAEQLATSTDVVE